jgi:hypothetical protein
MKAIITSKYGSVEVLQPQDVDRPIIADDEMLYNCTERVVMKNLNFCEKPVPQGFVVMQPVPSQLLTNMAEMEHR